MRGLSERQQQILTYLTTCRTERGYTPSIREIGDAVGLSSPASALRQLKILGEKGLIERTAGKARCLKIRQEEGSFASLPEDIVLLPVMNGKGRTFPVRKADLPEHGKADDCVVLQSPVSVSSFGILKGSLVLVCCRLKEEHALYAVFDQGHLSFSPKPATKAVLGFVFAVYSRV